MASNIINFAPSADVTFLNKYHPDQERYCSPSFGATSYTANAFSYLDRLWLLNRGGEDLRINAAVFLPKGAKELGAISQDRVSKFTYKNLISTILGWFNAKLFGGDIDIRYKSDGVDSLPDDAEAFYQGFLQNADGAGTTLAAFFQQLSVDFMLMGHAYFLLDLPKVDGFTSLGEQIAAGGLSPYLVRFDARSVLNWSKTDQGILEWILIKTTDQIQVPFQPTVQRDRWTFYTQTVYATYEATWSEGKAKPTTANLVSTGPHALSHMNQVPVNIISSGDDLWIANKVSLQLVEYLILDNTYAYSLNYSNVPIPVLENGNMGGVEIPCDMSAMASQWSIINLPTNGSFHYAEVAGATFENSAKRLDSLREDIFRACHLQSQSRSNKQTSAISSGWSKELDLAPSFDILDKLATITKSAMMKALDDIASIRGDENITPDVRGLIFVESELGAKLDRVVIYESLKFAEVSPTFMKQQYKDLNHTANVDADEGILAIIDSEIDSYVPPITPAPLATAPVVTETIRTTE